MPAQSIVDEALCFIREYTDVFNSRVGDRIAALYNVPCVTMRADGSIHCFQSRQEIERFFQQVADGYAKEGMHTGVFRNFSAVPMGARSVLVTVDWDMLGADGGAIRQWRQSYNLVRVDNVWRILAATIHLP